MLFRPGASRLLSCGAFFLYLAITGKAGAINASPFPVELTQPGGTKIVLHPKGANRTVSIFVGGSN